ncbi:hypothetical protein LJC40_04550 [Synergistaceae bacterium OttesenSCG-928-D05]|nr:hypothetical protein [Synergistaceae bacterium OttesenSCG-928-D05]
MADCGRLDLRRHSVVFTLVFFLALTGFSGGPAIVGFSEAEAAQSAPWNGSTADSFAGGDGTAANPYQIATAEQLAFLAAAVNAKSKDNDTKPYTDKHYKLTADIDLGGTHQWTPIGVPEDQVGDAPFAGTFDGDGHVVTGMKIVSDDYKYWQAGLFGNVSSDVTPSAPVIKNLSLTDFIISVDRGTNGGAQVGGLVGYFVGDSIRNVFVSGTVVAAANNDDSHSHVGGIAGRFFPFPSSTTTTLSSSSASGTVSAIANGSGNEADAFAGGLVGDLNANAIITSSYASANVSSRSSGGTSGAGGLVGNVGGAAKLYSSYASGSVYSHSSGGSSNAGGLGGKVAGEIINSYATGPVHADAAAANLQDVLAGGLTGILEGMDNGHIKTSYAWGAVSAGTTAGAKRGGLIGKTADAKVTVQSNDWRRDSAPGGINFDLDPGIGSDIRSVDQLIHAKSLDVSLFHVSNQNYFESQDWNFTGTWCYTDLDNGVRPHLRTFFGADENTISPDIVRITPNIVTISAGETKYLQLTAAGWEKLINSMTFTPSALNGVTISQSLTSPDVIVLAAADALTAASADVFVDFMVNALPQNRLAFGLTVIGSPDIPPIPPTPPIPPGAPCSSSSSGCASGVGIPALLVLAVLLRKRR